MKEKDQESIETPEGVETVEEMIETADGEPMEQTLHIDEDDEDEDDDSESIIDMLREEKEELNRRLLRSHADLENLRKRSVRERQESVRYANKQIFLAMLDCLDNFDRALSSAPDPKDNFVIGVAMIHKQLLDVFSQNGVELIKAMGEAFDPHRHEALAREESADHEDNTIIEEFQKGYLYNGALLRPSKVKVSVRPTETEEETGEATEAGNSDEAE